MEVFDPAGNHLTSILNANTPCGLAVDSDGTLYVSESVTGEVVRYEPSVFPLTGSPTYGPREVIDASGDAKGIAVDPFDNRLYVARGDRVMSYDSEGKLGVDEVQGLLVSNASGGTFRLALPGEGGGGRNEIQAFDPTFTAGTYTLTFEGGTTSSLAAHASALAVEEALESLPGIGNGNVSVRGFPDGSKWIEFIGTLANVDVPLIVGNGVTVSALSDISAPIAYEAPAANVEAALEVLDGVGPGNVSVTVNGSRYFVAFTGALAHTDVPSLAIDHSGLTPNGSGFNPEARLVNEGGAAQGWSGQVGFGDLTDATGVAAYTYPINEFKRRRSVFVADAATNEIKTFAGGDFRALSPWRVNDGSATPAGSFNFETAGAYLATDAGTCPPAGQACTAGHLFVYDAGHEVLDEFEAGGAFVDVTESPSFEDAAPTAIAVDRSGGPTRGTLYATTGAGPGAKVLAFKYLPTPQREPLASLSRTLAQPRAVAVDSFGNVYAAAGAIVHVYDPSGDPLTSFEDPNGAADLDVDSTGKVYVLDLGIEQVTYYTPSAYPPTAVTTYARHDPPVAVLGDLPPGGSFLTGIGVNPGNDHVFVTHKNDTIELRSAKEGSSLLNKEIGAGLGVNQRLDVAPRASNGYLYIVSEANQGASVQIVDPAKGAHGEKVGEITGVGSPNGKLSGGPTIAVDQESGHVIVFDNHQGAALEFDETGSFLTEFGEFTKGFLQEAGFRVAVDNGASSPNKGNAYIAFDDSKPGTPDVWAFGPLLYGGPPQQLRTSLATDVEGGNATLNGTLDPRWRRAHRLPFRVHDRRRLPGERVRRSRARNSALRAGNRGDWKKQRGCGARRPEWARPRRPLSLSPRGGERVRRQRQQTTGGIRASTDRARLRAGPAGPLRRSDAAGERGPRGLGDHISLRIRARENL